MAVAVVLLAGPASAAPVLDAPSAFSRPAVAADRLPTRFDTLQSGRGRPSDSRRIATYLDGKHRRWSHARGVLNVAAAAVLATLHVTGFVPDSPSEGTFWGLQVRSGPVTVFEARLLARDLTLRLGPGRYVLVSFLRQCGENCESVGPPTSRCSAPFRVSRGERLQAVVRYKLDGGCTIFFRR
jgi:hypothetical protein